MNLTLQTYNSATITGYGAKPRGESIGLEAAGRGVERADTWLAYAGKAFKPEEFDIIFDVDNAEGAGRQTQLETLGGLFNTRDQDLHWLVAQDTNGTVNYYLEATPIKFNVQGGIAIARMWTPDPVWKSTQTHSGTISVAGTTLVTGTITPAGNVDTYPTITITPSATGGFYAYRYNCVIYNPTAHAYHNYPLNVAGTAWNSAAEISAGRLQADGDDVKVLVDGVSVERWTGALNTAAGKVWSVLNFAPKIELKLKTAIADSGVTKLEFQGTPYSSSISGLLAYSDAMRRLPARGILLIDNECIAYSSKQVNKFTVTLDDEDSRGVKDTTAASHSAGATVRWIEHDIVILTGNTIATAPEQTDNRKPAFSLANSTNTEWRYDAADSVFGDVAGLRAGGWKPAKPAGAYSDFYTGNQGTVGTDPITTLGMEVVSYPAGTVYKSEAAWMMWTLQNNAGLTSISSVGEMYRGTATTLWPKARLTSSLDGETFVTEWSQATPGTTGTWGTWTHGTESLPTGTRFVRFVFRGAVNAVEDAVADFGVSLGSSGSTGVSVDGTNIPQVTLLSRADNSELNFTLTNTTTGEAMSYSYPLKTNKTLTINTLTRLVSYRNHLLAPPELDSVRQEWFRLVPGANVITFEDQGNAGLSLVITYRNRKNV